MGTIVKLELTRHCVQRLLQRRSNPYRKLSPQAICDTFRNLVRSAKLISFDRDLMLVTPNYCLVCTPKQDVLVVKTVLDSSQVPQHLTKLGCNPGWDAWVITPQSKIKRWMSSQ